MGARATSREFACQMQLEATTPIDLTADWCTNLPWGWPSGPGRLPALAEMGSGLCTVAGCTKNKPSLPVRGILVSPKVTVAHSVAELQSRYYELC